MTRQIVGGFEYAVRVAVVLGVLCVVAGWSVNAAQAADPGLKVEARGLRVVGEGYGEENGLRPFNWFPGVTVALLVTSPAGGLIEFDSRASEVTKLVDNKGTDLMVRGEFSMPGFTGSEDVSDDGKAMMIDVGGGGVPAKGADSIQVTGTLAIRRATQQKVHKADNVAVKADQKIEAGPVAFTISSVGKPDWGDNPLRITLEAKQHVDTIAEIRFLDAGGAVIESHRTGSMTMSMGDDVQVTLEFDLAKAVESFSVEVVYWTDLQTAKVPFDVTVRVGL